MVSQLQNCNEICTLRVNANIHEQLTKHFKDLELDPYSDFYKAALKASEILEEELNFGLLNAIKEFGVSKLGEGVMLIKGLPVSFSKLPLTPTNETVTNGKDFLSEYIALGSGQLLKSVPYLNQGEKDGNVIHQIVPLEGKESEQSSRGSNIAFDWHTENVHEVSPPHYLGLFCLRGEAHAKTQVLHLMDLINALPNRVVATLFKDKFEFKTGPSYNFASSFQSSVLSKNVDGNIHIRYNSSPGRLQGIDKESDEALVFLRNWLKYHAKVSEIVLEEGDFLILDNRKTLHGRSSFKMSPSLKARRWLQRVYFRSV